MKKLVKKNTCLTFCLGKKYISASNYSVTSPKLDFPISCEIGPYFFNKAFLSSKTLFQFVLYVAQQIVRGNKAA